MEYTYFILACLNVGCYLQPPIMNDVMYEKTGQLLFERAPCIMPVQDIAVIKFENTGPGPVLF